MVYLLDLDTYQSLIANMYQSQVTLSDDVIFALSCLGVGEFNILHHLMLMNNSISEFRQLGEQDEIWRSYLEIALMSLAREADSGRTAELLAKFVIGVQSVVIVERLFIPCYEALKDSLKPMFAATIAAQCFDKQLLYPEELVGATFARIILCIQEPTKEVAEKIANEIYMKRQQIIDARWGNELANIMFLAYTRSLDPSYANKLAVVLNECNPTKAFTDEYEVRLKPYIDGPQKNHPHVKSLAKVLRRL